MNRFVIAACAALACAPAMIHAREAGQVRLTVLDKPVEVVYDTFAIPHIYAASPEDAYRTLGYLHAVNRLFQMDLFRRRAEGRLSEIIGPDGFQDDLLMRQLGIRRTCEEAFKSGILGKDLERALIAYSEGVNARLKEIETPEGGQQLPLALKTMGIRIDPWEPVNTLSWMKYMGWDQGGTDSDLWLGMMLEKMGPAAIEELWPLDRPYEMPTVPSWPPQGVPAIQGSSLRSPSADLTALASARLNAGDAFIAMHDRLQGAGLLRDLISHGSNNWVVSGAKSTTGAPILCNDPHLGLNIPSIWYSAHLVAPGLDVAGATFPTGPFVVIGHNSRIAWGVTNMQSDQVDYFIETVNPSDPTQYRHKGEWKKFEERTETILVKGEAAPREVIVRSTVHGPVSEIDGRTLALCWTGLRVTAEARAIFHFNKAQGLSDFVKAARELAVPAMNIVYADVEGNIAIAPHGDLPIRASGHGRVPVDGASGDFDWVGFIPPDELPISINPGRGWLASANGRPHPLGYPHYLGYMWDPAYRTRRIAAMLDGDRKFSIDDMKRIIFDSHDFGAEVFVPELIKAFDAAPYGDAPTRQAIEILRAWDYNCLPEYGAPLIFNAWLEKYRRATWDDEWTARNIRQPGGSWGFTGNNNREPMLEVFEYMTRENPRSIWFDDHATPEVETRDDIMKRAFESAVSDLRKAHGDDPASWKWGAVNILRISPLMPVEKLARGGMPVVGGPFTVNPGGEGGHVGGGACLRMIANLGNLSESLAVYPGGQSDDPRSPHYDDQVSLWVGGELAPMHFKPSAADFDPAFVGDRALFTP